MPHNPNHDSTPLLGDQTGQANTLDAFLFKDGLADLVHALMEEGDWSIPAEVEEKQFVDDVFMQMRTDVRTWVRHASRYFLDNSEYFLSNKEALEILDEELAKREVEVVATAADTAGNEAEEVSEQVGVDGVPPRVDDLTVPDVPLRRGAPFTVSFDCDEPPPAELAVQVGGRDMQAAAEAEPRRCVFTHTTDGEDQEGTNVVTVAAEDAAGNRSRLEGDVVFDFTAPVLEVTVEPEDRHARVGETVRVTVTSDEPLARGALTLAHEGLALAPVDEGTATSRTWTYTVQNGDLEREVSGAGLKPVLKAALTPAFVA